MIQIPTRNLIHISIYILNQILRHIVSHILMRIQAHILILITSLRIIHTRIHILTVLNYILTLRVTPTSP